jgi:membrane protein
MRFRHVLWTATNDWLADNAQRSAAALAYYSVFSLAPLLLISIGIAGVVLGHDSARDQILGQATSLLGPQGAAAIELLMGTRESAPRAGLVSTVTGITTLLVGAVGVLAQLKHALNTVWDVAPAQDAGWRTFVRSYVVNVALVIATGFLLLVSLIFTAMVSAATASARSLLPGPDGIWVVLDATIGLSMTALVFALIFKVLPDTHVGWRDVWVGALVTSVLFTVGRLALGAYLGREGADSAYGAAGSVLALLAWVYYTAQLVLLGAEFTHVWSGQARRHPALTRASA